MRKIVTALVLLCQAGAVYAQDVKQELKQHLQGLQDFNAAFSQQVTATDGQVVQESSGQLWLQQPRKLRWQTQDPDLTELVSDGDTVWYYSEFLEQVSIYPLQALLADNPMLFLTEPDSASWQHMDIAQVEPSHFSVTTNNDGQIAKIELKFAQTQLQELIVVDATGQVSRFSFSDIGATPAASDTFSFTVPQGVEIDDQR